VSDRQPEQTGGATKTQEDRLRQDTSSPTRPRRSVQMLMAIAIPVMILAALLIVRQGSDSGDGPQGGGRYRSYCASLLERDSIRIPPPVENPSDEVRREVALTAGRLILVTERMLEEAPDAVRPHLETQVATYRDLVRSRNPARFEAEQLRDARNRANAVDVESCSLETVEFRATEYAYVELPGRLQHSRASLRMRNVGDEPHEMVLFRTNPDFSGDFAETLAAGREAEDATTLDSLRVAPGNYDVVTVDLSGGQYIMACFARSGRQEHWEFGMVSEFVVD